MNSRLICLASLLLACSQKSPAAQAGPTGKSAPTDKPVPSSTAAPSPGPAPALTPAARPGSWPSMFGDAPGLFAWERQPLLGSRHEELAQWLPSATAEPVPWQGQARVRLPAIDGLPADTTIAVTLEHGKVSHVSGDLATTLPDAEAKAALVKRLSVARDLHWGPHAETVSGWDQYTNPSLHRRLRWKGSIFQLDGYVPLVELLGANKGQLGVETSSTLGVKVKDLPPLMPTGVFHSPLAARFPDTEWDLTSIEFYAPKGVVAGYRLELAFADYPNARQAMLRHLTKVYGTPTPQLHKHKKMQYHALVYSTAPLVAVLDVGVAAPATEPSATLSRDSDHYTLVVGDWAAAFR